MYTSDYHYGVSALSYLWVAISFWSRCRYPWTLPNIFCHPCHSFSYAWTSDLIKNKISSTLTSGLISFFNFLLYIWVLNNFESQWKLILRPLDVYRQNYFQIISFSRIVYSPTRFHRRVHFWKKHMLRLVLGNAEKIKVHLHLCWPLLRNLRFDYVARLINDKYYRWVRRSKSMVL